MKSVLNFKHLKTPFLIIFSFILGSMFTLNITPLDRTCTIQNTDKEHNIMKDSKLKNPDLIVTILSTPMNKEKRNVLRETWLKLYRPNKERSDQEQFKIKHYFVVGTLGLSKQQLSHLDSEQLRYKDLLLIPMYDHYKNLTDKVKYIFEWLDEQNDYGLDFKYVLKCDDDSFVNLKLLISELLTIERLYLTSDLQNSLQLIAMKQTDIMTLNVQINDKMANNNLNLYWGYFSGSARIKTKGKWKENDWIVSDRYLPYALGGGYLLSKNLVRYISQNSKILRCFNSEDVSVGLWLAPVDNILRIHDVRFDTEWTTRGCQNNYLITHSIIPSMMKMMFDNLVIHRQLCTQETKKRNYYLYNWSVPPSQCCKTIEDSIIRLAKH